MTADTIASVDHALNDLRLRRAAADEAGDVETFTQLDERLNVLLERRFALPCPRPQS